MVVRRVKNGYASYRWPETPMLLLEIHGSERGLVGRSDGNLRSTCRRKRRNRLQANPTMERSVTTVQAAA